MVPPYGHASAGKSQQHSPREKSPPPPAKTRRVNTLQACGECRRKRAKCDGQQPCQRCQTQLNMECVYDITLRRSKEELRVELQMLRDRQASHAELLAIVAEPESSDQVLGFLRTGHSIETILSRVKEARTSKDSDNSWSDSASPSVSDLALARLRAGLGGETASGSGGNSSGAAHEGSYSQPLAKTNYQSQQLTNTDQHEHALPVEDTVEITGLEKTLWPLGAPATAAAPEEWTFLTGDPGLIHHLMALYFCWEYPLFTSLSREHFMNDFHHGYHRFCSPLLVNAMLALGSCWDGQPKPQSKFTDLNTHGDQFFKESVRLLGEQEDCRSLSTVQALGLMAMWEISHGRDVEGRYYSAQSSRLAMDMGLHRTVDEGDWDLYYVQALTFWGAFSLDSLLSLASGSLPQYPFSSPRLHAPSIPSSIEQSPWLPYTGKILPHLHSTQQTSNIRSTYGSLCVLADMIHDALYMLYSPVNQPTVTAVLKIYTHYLSWYDQMPESLRLGLNSTPAVLSSRMCYHFAIIQLFHPFLDLQLIGARLSPASICHQAADAIQGLLKSYSQIHTLNRTPVFIPFVAMASAISHLEKRIIAEPATEAYWDTNRGTLGGLSYHALGELDQDISDLRVMSGRHYSAVQAVGFLRSLARERKIELSSEEHSISTKDYDRLARPYLRRISIESGESNVEEAADYYPGGGG